MATSTLPEDRDYSRHHNRTGAARSDFEKQVAIDTPSFVALARRLVEDTLTPKERELYTRTVRILELRDAGKNIRDSAMELNLTLKAITNFVGRGTFRIMARFAKERRVNPSDKDRVLREKGERARFESLGPKALDYIESCFVRDPKDPSQWKDKKEARWATELIARGKGWDEPDAARRQIGELRVAVVVAQQQAIAASDRAHHPPPAHLTIDVTPQPAEPPKEEAAPEVDSMAPELEPDTDDADYDPDTMGELPDEPIRSLGPPR